MGKPKERPEFGGTGALCVAARKLPVGSVAMKCLLLYFAICTDYTTGTFFKSYLEIYMDTGITERTARRCIDGLKTAKILETFSPEFGSRHSTVYRLRLKEMERLIKGLETAKEERVAAVRHKNTQKVQRWRAKQEAKKTADCTGHQSPLQPA